MKPFPAEAPRARPGRRFTRAPRPTRFHAVALLAGLLCLDPVQAGVPAEAAIPGAEKTAVSSDHVGPIQLQEVPVDQVLLMLERWTGKSILRPHALPAVTVSLNLKEEVTKAQGIRAIETLLNLNGIAVTSLDEAFLKVTALGAAKAEAPPWIAGSTLDLPPSGQIASKLFHPRFLRVGDFIPQIGGLLNPAVGGAPVVIDKANTALITDSITTLQRIETLLAQVDRPELARLQPDFFTLRYAKASEVVAQLRAMLSGSLQNDLGSATYNADDRSNQIVVFSDPQLRPVFAQLIARLDVKSGQDTRSDFIILKHAKAKEVASILSQLVAGQSHPDQLAAVDTSPRREAAANPPALASAPSPATGEPASGEASSPLADLALPPPARFSAALTILPEERSNAIILSGTDNDIRLLRDLIARIDILLAQVRIEVVIAEVTLDDNDTTGIGALGLRIRGDKLVGFSGSLPGTDIANGTIGPAGDLAAEITLAATPRKSHTHILSVPNIITTHNREGKIFVGEEVPVISGYLNTGNGAGNGGVGAGYLSTVNSKDIGIQLTVTPLIGADGSVQMEITQEVNDVLGQVTIDGNPQPRIGRRSTESFVSAHSGEVIVLGGLQRTSLSRSTSRLGPIPILGDLLGSRSREKTRTDLVFFLRPTVLTNPARDNAAALHHIEEFPDPQRTELKQALQLPVTAQKP
jgi:general secretion pathway protein D